MFHAKVIFKPTTFEQIKHVGYLFKLINNIAFKIIPRVKVFKIKHFSEILLFFTKKKLINEKEIGLKMQIQSWVNSTKSILPRKHGELGKHREHREKRRLKKNQVPSSKFQIPNSKYQIPRSKFQIPRCAALGLWIWNLKLESFYVENPEEFPHFDFRCFL